MLQTATKALRIMRLINSAIVGVAFVLTLGLSVELFVLFRELRMHARSVCSP